MQYMALIYGDEEVWAGSSEEEHGRRIRAVPRVRPRGRGRRRSGGRERARPTRNATTVRVRDDEALVTDGPYTEVKEALGGFYLLECASMDEAIEWAARIPGAEHGAVEVRPVFVDPEEAQP